MQLPHEITSRSEKETLAFAEKWAKSVSPGSVIFFEGNLGSGKTTFIKGFAKGLGLDKEDDVKSPTFVLLHIYPTKIPLYHFDLYRLESKEELEAIGFEEFVNDSKAISCVEWGEKAQTILPHPSFRVLLSIVDEHSRKIVVKKG